jgi:uncharacterized protein (DUF302 family)
MSENSSGNGIIIVQSQYSVKESIDRFQQVLSAKGVQVFARIDQQAEAKKAGLDLPPTELIIFGNPHAGTPVMEAFPLAALDLPLKLLAWSHDESTVWLTYNDAAWLGKRHGLSKDMIQTLDFSPLLASLVKKQ